MKHALFAMIPQALMVILLIYIGGMVNPLPIDSDSSANSTIGLKVCCDSLCSEPISSGRTQQRHITRDMGFLSYPASANVTVLAKGAYFGEYGEEFWKAEIMGEQGLIRSTAINEMTCNCQPQDFSKEDKGNVKDGLPGDGTSSYETDRQSNSDQIHPMTEPDLVSDSRPVDDQLDVTQRLTKEQDDQFDTPSASGWKREDEEGMHPDEQEQPAISEVAYQYQPKDFSKDSSDHKKTDHHSSKWEWIYTAKSGWQYTQLHQDEEEGKVEDGLPGDGTSSYETDRQSNSDQIPPMTEQDLVSDSRPVDDQLDVTQQPTEEHDDRFDTPASGWKREDEEGMHPDEQEQPAINEVAYQYQPKEFSKEDKGNVESDINGHNHVRTRDPNLLGIDTYMIYLRSIGHQPRHDVHPSPSVTQLHGGDAEQPSLSTESQKDNRLEQEYTSSQVPSEDQKEDTNDNGNDDDVHSSAFQNKIPLTEADTRPSDTPSSGIEAPSIGNETPPPSQSDGYDHQQLDTASKLDPSLLGVNDINRQSSHPDPSPSVIQLPGEKDNRVEQQYSSQLPLEEQEQDDNKDGHSVFVDGTHLPDYVDDDDDDVCTAPFQSAVFTQSVASTPILGSNSTNMVNDGATCDQEPPSLDEIKAHQGEGLRAQSEHDSHQQTATNDDDARTTPFHITPMKAVIMTSVAYLSLFTMIWYLSGRSNKQKLDQMMLAYYKHNLEVLKTQNDKSVLERKLRECEDRYRDFQGKMKQEIEKLQSQVAAVVSEREGALEQATQLSASLRELEQKVQGLEAQKDQLEEDKFTTQTVLQELQSQHEQVTAELEETKEQCEGLKNELSSLTVPVQPSVVKRLKRAVSFWSSCKRNTKVEN